MPRKPPRNAFYFFMVHFKEEQRQNGITYANMAEVSQAAGPLWTQTGPEERARFEAMAKEEKARASAPENRLTNTGAIKKFVAEGTLNDSLLDEDIFVMDVNCYCKAHGTYQVGEVTLLRFTLRNGVRDKYHQLVNPGIPYAYTSDVKYWSKQFALPMIDERDRRSDYVQIFADIMDLMKTTEGAPSRDELPPVYTMPDKVPQCSSFLMQLSRKATQNETVFRVYQLHTLYYQLVYQISPKYQKDEYFTKEAVALTQLQRDTTFKYCSGLACQMHDEADRALVCTSVRALSWTYTILETTCALLGVRAQPGRHQPDHYEPQEELAMEPSYRRIFADNPEREACPGCRSVNVPAASVGPKLPNDNPSAAAAVEKKRDVPLRTPESNMATITEEARHVHVPLRKPIDPIPIVSSKKSPAAAPVEERRHVPLRMPKTDFAVAAAKKSHIPAKTNYSMSARTAPALTDDRRDFPSLASRGRDSLPVRAAPGLTTADRRDFPLLSTRGRGRGLAEYLHRMRI
ncbi:piRNA pathway germ-plasm component domain-containing protein [Phthorimaea operculella]|nr:piRNA pathway germ-plasm component domain-containing protein [Phthorimaea operculella]